MEICLGHGPFPHADDNIAFDTLRPLRFLAGQLSSSNAVRPVRKQCQRFGTELAERESHVSSCLSSLYPAGPCIERVGGCAPFLLERTHALGTQRVTRLARVLHRVDPVMLRLHDFPNAVAVQTAAWELAFWRNLKQRVPVNAWIVFGRSRRARRRYGSEIELPPDFRLHLLGIDKSVPAHPDVVRSFRKLGNEVSSLIVGDDDLRELRRQVRRFRDDPHACFRPLRTGVDASKLRTAYLDRGRRRPLRLKARSCARQTQGNSRDDS